jgi:hypothetical protein
VDCYRFRPDLNHLQHPLGFSGHPEENTLFCDKLRPDKVEIGMSQNVCVPDFYRPIITSVTLCLAAWCLTLKATAEDTFIYTVQLSATVQESPPRVNLNWQQDPYGAIDYTIYRKDRDGTTWGYPIGTMPGSATSFTDSAVSIGAAYEYQVVKNTSRGYRGYGYIYVGVLAPLSDQRGKVVLLTATESVAGLGNEVDRLGKDLAGDGWQVVRRDVSSNSSPQTARAIVREEYAKDPANVRAVFLLGHVPVLRSGYMDYDGHLTRSMPADAYYGEMDDVWPTDPGASPSYMPSDIELMVGRVDFFDMPGAGAAVSWPNERELLRRYLDKDHAWRHGLMTVPRRALMGNRRGDEEGVATAASGYRNFEPIVGPGNTFEAETSDKTVNANRWISVLGRESYLMAYGCGGGLPYGVSWLGTNGPYKEAWSRDVVAVDAKAVFVMLFGSWFGEWDKQDNFMRSFLATSKGLAVSMAGWPHWYMHHSALGEPIGLGAKVTMNNSTLYRNAVNGMPRAVYIALMGDPTLRIDVVRPVSGLSATRQDSAVALSWTASPDGSEGAHVYRGASELGPFTRLTSSPVQTTSFIDNWPTAGQPVYMVRAIKKENRFSGSYFNGSQGKTVLAPAAPPAPPLIQARYSAGQLVLTWNTVPGTSYRVQGKSSAGAPWSDISSSLWASGESLTWSTPVNGQNAGLFRVRSD